MSQCKQTEHTERGRPNGWLELDCITSAAMVRYGFVISRPVSCSYVIQVSDPTTGTWTRALQSLPHQIFPSPHPTFPTWRFAHRPAGTYPTAAEQQLPEVFGRALEGQLLLAHVGRRLIVLQHQVVVERHRLLVLEVDRDGQHKASIACFAHLIRRVVFHCGVEWGKWCSDQWRRASPYHRKLYHGLLSEYGSETRRSWRMLNPWRQTAELSFTVNPSISRQPPCHRYVYSADMCTDPKVGSMISMNLATKA